jgi:ATP-dependent Clp protease ATP-binding subunit ClpA
MKELSFGEYADKLGKSAEETLALAIEESRKRNQHYLAPSQLILALLHSHEPLFSELFDSSTIIESITKEVRMQADSESDYGASGRKMTLDVKTLFRLAWISCFQNGRKKIEAVDLLNALTQIVDSPLPMLFHKYGLPPERVAAFIRKLVENPISARISIDLSEIEFREEPEAKDDEEEIVPSPQWSKSLRFGAIIIIVILILIFAALLLAAEQVFAADASCSSSVAHFAIC